MCAICANTHNELILPKKYNNNDRAALNVVSWHPRWEEVETERKTSKRVKNGVFASNMVKNGPNRA